ncbi:ATPase SWSAP1 [Rhineura floridana]|uniref:ATPase SWSAP1 n=1 Tax=Rhineura floridana TaxID=261503 RepID=UPI002AC889A0|nr:ATPase SWSAP1 [Rhineura floridana]
MSAVTPERQLLLLLLGAVPAGLRPRPRLLIGPAGSGRSALLFRAALVAASSSPGRVLFLAPRPLERLPAGDSSRAEAGAIQRIHFLYPPSFQELLQLAASLHETLSGTLSLVVLDGLEEYLGSCSSPSMAAQLVALLLDTANHFSQKLTMESAVGCHLIISMRFSGEAGEQAEYLSVIERYFPAQCWLHPVAGENAGSDSQDITKLIRACLSQPWTKDQEWLLRFDPQGGMKISLLPCKCEDDACTVSGNNRPPEAEAHPIVPSSQS